MREEDTVCVGSDGLQYCKVCGEAKEAFFPEGGFMGMKKHSRQCACDRKAYEEEQKYFKEKEHRELVSRNTSICFDESRMEEWTFENAETLTEIYHPDDMQRWKNMVYEFAERTGKTDPDDYYEEGRWRTRRGASGLKVKNVTMYYV